MSRMRFFVASNLSTCAWPCLLASFITPRNVRAAPVDAVESLLADGQDREGRPDRLQAGPHPEDRRRRLIGRSGIRLEHPVPGLEPALLVPGQAVLCGLLLGHCLLDVGHGLALLGRVFLGPLAGLGTVKPDLDRERFHDRSSQAEGVGHAAQDVAYSSVRTPRQSS